MPVYKYRRIEDVPEPWQMLGDRNLGNRIRALLSFGRALPALPFRRGVTKYHSFEEMAADRERYEEARIAARLPK
jgi:hypothetical protein